MSISRGLCLLARRCVLPIFVYRQVSPLNALLLSALLEHSKNMNLALMAIMMPLNHVLVNAFLCSHVAVSCSTSHFHFSAAAKKLQNWDKSL